MRKAILLTVALLILAPTAVQADDPTPTPMGGDISAQTFTFETEAEVPLPNFASKVEDILDYARMLLSLFDDRKLLWIIAAFSIIVTILIWSINMVQRPPKLDI